MEILFVDMPFWLLVLFCIPLYYAFRYLWELLELPDMSTRAIFITGCDSGFGRMLAIRCVRNGMLTYAGCLTQDGQSQLRAEINSLGLPEGRLVPVPLDVTNDDSVQKAVQFVRQHLPDDHCLWALVNNAGVLSCYGPDAWTPIDEYKESMEVNCWGCIRCTHAFLPLLKIARGRIISISSVAGRVSVPCGAPYAVAKYGVEAYMDAIRLELSVYGITCCILEPGMYRTKLLDEAKMHERVDRVWNRLSPELREEYGERFKQEFVNAWNTLFQSRANNRLDDVVDAYFHAITARFPRARYRIGWDAILIYIPYAFLPTAIGDALFRVLASTKKPILPALIEKERALLAKQRALMDMKN